MQKILIYIFGILPLLSVAQQKEKAYKKRVLESTEINILTSYYAQNGDHASVTGGIGREELRDYATDINVSIPVNADDVLTIDATVSAYSSASSSNLNPFTGASKKGDDDEEDDDRSALGSKKISGSPWIVSSGASKSDVWKNANISYSHSSDDRSNVWSGGLSVAHEFDYFSLGGNLSYLKLFNQENTGLHFGAKIYLDQWMPQYPTEIKTYIKNNGNLNKSYFKDVDIFDHNGVKINKNGTYKWAPFNTTLIQNKSRNTYTFTFSFSQILTQKMQFSLISELTYQQGWLANPLQRVYFADRDNFYIGNPASINHYTDKSNTDTFQLADDIERLPHNRLKIPLGLRWHYYVNENLVVKTYYRYYFDDWGLQSHTLELELPIKIGEYFTFYPNYRYYNQTAAKYFAPYETHLSTETYYTSDYDLSAFSARQIGLGIKYKDITTRIHFYKFGIKNISLNYNYYRRTNGMFAHIVSLGTKIIMD